MRLNIEIEVPRDVNILFVKKQATQWTDLMGWNIVSVAPPMPDKPISKYSTSFKNGKAKRRTRKNKPQQSEDSDNSNA
jgi:hypothetical protein